MLVVFSALGHWSYSHLGKVLGDGGKYIFIIIMERDDKMGGEEPVICDPNDQFFVSDDSTREVVTSEQQVGLFCLI